MRETLRRITLWWNQQHVLVRGLIGTLLLLVVLKEIQATSERFWLKLPSAPLPESDGRLVLQRMRIKTPELHEHNRHLVVLGISRRIDDAYFWAFVALVGG